MAARTLWLPRWSATFRLSCTGQLGVAPQSPGTLPPVSGEAGFCVSGPGSSAQALPAVPGSLGPPRACRPPPAPFRSLRRALARATVSDRAPRIKPVDPIRSAAAGIPPAPDAPMTANADTSRRTVYSITALAEMTGYHRNTISDWTRRKENPLPTVSGGSHGVEYRISLRRLMEWREEIARQEGIKGAVEGGFQFMGIRDPNSAFQARLRFISMGEIAR